MPVPKSEFNDLINWAQSSGPTTIWAIDTLMDREDQSANYDVDFAYYVGFIHYFKQLMILGHKIPGDFQGPLSQVYLSGPPQPACYFAIDLRDPVVVSMTFYGGLMANQTVETDNLWLHPASQGTHMHLIAEYQGWNYAIALNGTLLPKLRLWNLHR